MWKGCFTISCEISGDFPGFSPIVRFFNVHCSWSEGFESDNQVGHVKFSFQIQLNGNILLPSFRLPPGFVLICSCYVWRFMPIENILKISKQSIKDLFITLFHEFPILNFLNFLSNQFLSLFVYIFVKYVAPLQEQISSKNSDSKKLGSERVQFN